ncbi:MAG: type II toxin-antitoxin system RelE/ParE family toxin [Planctomycetota bacterium]
MNVVLRDEARGDIVDGASFFDGQREGLGDYLVDCVFEDLRTIESHSVLHEVVFGLHRKVVNRFTFAIYYWQDSDTVDVIAILDCRRDPSLILETLQQREP